MAKLSYFSTKSAGEQLESDKGMRAVDSAFTALCEAAPLGIALVDSRLRFVWVNDALCRHLGYSRKEFLELGVDDISRPDRDDERTRAQFVQGEVTEVTLERRHITKEGVTKWAHVQACVFCPEDNEDQYAALFVEDISERIQLEGKLAHQASVA